MICRRDIPARDFFDGDEDLPMQNGLAGAAALDERLRALPGVRAVLPRIQFSGLISNGDKSAIFIGAGVVPELDFRVRGPQMRFIEGEPFGPGSAVPEIGHLTWDDYLEKGPLKAVDVVLDITGAERTNALGFCVGGTILSCAAAVMAARQDRRLATITLLTTMLDFSDTGEIGLLIDDASVALREATIGKGGILPGKELAFTFGTRCAPTI